MDRNNARSSRAEPAASVTDETLHTAWNATEVQWHRVVNATEEEPSRFTPEHRAAGAELCALQAEIERRGNEIFQRHGLQDWSVGLRLVSTREARTKPTAVPLDQDERVRLAYCHSWGLPLDTPAETVRKIIRYASLVGCATRSDEEELEVQALHSEFGEWSGWHVVPRDTKPPDLGIFQYPRKQGAL